MQATPEASTGCPPAPPLVRIAGRKLMIARAGTKEERESLGPLELLPRPWLPHTCHPSLLRVLLRWLDEVAGWLNHDYTWKLARPIPDCWPEHPHILHELAALAWLRLIAEQALDPGPLEDWQRYALPSFYNRLAERLGNGCATKHDPWPGTPRHAGYSAPDAVHARQEAFERLVSQQHQARERDERPAQLELGGPESDSPEQAGKSFDH